MNDRTKAWGSPDREYAQDPDSYGRYSDRDLGPLPDIEHQSSIWRMAVRHSLGDETQAIVQRTVKHWNGAVRESLRKQTGLRLSMDLDPKGVVGRKRKVQSVPVRVVSGLPIRFATRVGNITPLELMLSLNRLKLERVVSGTSFMKEHFQELSAIQSEGSSRVSQDEVKKVSKFAEELLNKIKYNDQWKRILEIDEDVLGAYFFTVPEIRLYWIVIGIYSRILDLEIEALTVVVLVHELAHAYTHLGYDIDNRNWKTEDFARSDVYLVEGLAQFYTQVICEQIEPKLPAAKNAFEKLLDVQSTIYKEHQKWSTSEDSEHVGETVRISMLECRSKGIIEASYFRSILEKYRNNFGQNIIED